MRKVADRRIGCGTGTLKAGAPSTAVPNSSSGSTPNSVKVTSASLEAASASTQSPTAFSLHTDGPTRMHAVLLAFSFAAAAVTSSTWRMSNTESRLGLDFAALVTTVPRVVYTSIHAPSSGAALFLAAMAASGGSARLSNSSRVASAARLCSAGPADGRSASLPS